MNRYILTSSGYQNWFASIFKFTAFINETKWYSTDIVQGKEDYTIADGMVKFSKQNGISIRGHNVIWDDPNMQPCWLKSLSTEEIGKAAEKRINSVVPRYRGQLIAWDEVNENLHFRFFEDKLTSRKWFCSIL
jgi:GH35 family endo-1,4-beta-xylanase